MPAIQPNRMMGKLNAIWIKRVRKGLMDPTESAQLVEGRGLEGSANQGGRRQVTLLELEVWEDLMRQLGADNGPDTRRANLLVSGLSLMDSRGRILRVGGQRIRIFGETKPCRQMEEAVPGLQDLMRPEWRGGAFGKVLDTGPIRVGDPVQWETDGAGYL